ncbi:MAG TPA: YhjD/YihY/BrkB family envelope integrity protein [Gammaproteobacteria bacterium]|jgi:membrane protein|nr:YhjD/YihY/BrkB family envelope integrity protein [Gammaproteobacteria bacterium]
MLKRLSDKFSSAVWQQDVYAMSRTRRILTFWVRMGNVLMDELLYGDLRIRAMALVYITILALVPFLAFAFSVLKGFGVQHKLQPLLANLFMPLGARGVEIAAKVIDFVNNVKAGILGTVGLALLLYTVVTTVRMVETAFNHVWRVREPRGFMEGFGHYISVILIGPLLLVSAFGLTATISSQSAVQHIIDLAPVGVLLVAAAKLLPYVFVILAFTFLYMFVPNTHVQFRSALIGAVIAGVGWEVAGYIFTELSAQSTRLTAIYSGFAIMMMFMVWLYTSWIIVLVGTQIAFYVQNPELVRYGLKHNEVGGRTMERVAVHIMYLVGRAYEEGHTPWSREQLARRLHLPTDLILNVLERLCQRGLLAVVSGKIRRYMPAYDIAEMTLREVVMAVRRNPEQQGDADKHIKTISQAEDVIRKLDTAANETLGKITLKEFISQGEPAELETATVLLARQSKKK